MARFMSRTAFQPELPKFFQCIIFRFTFPGSSAVNRFIMHQDEMPILCFLQIYFHHINPHVNAILNTLQRVFGSIAPIGTMRNN